MSPRAATDGVTSIFPEKTDGLFCSSLSLFWISLGCHPLEGVIPDLFLPIRPRLSIVPCKLATIFFHPGVTPCRLSPGAVRPTSHSDATGYNFFLCGFVDTDYIAVISWTNHLFIVIMANAYRNADLSVAIFRPLRTGYRFTVKIGNLFLSCISVTFESTFYFYLLKQIFWNYFLLSRN